MRFPTTIAKKKVREIVVPREEDEVLGDDSHDGRDALPDNHRDDVAVCNVCEFGSENSFEFVLVEIGRAHV